MLTTHIFWREDVCYQRLLLRAFRGTRGFRCSSDATCFFSPNAVIVRISAAALHLRSLLARQWLRRTAAFSWLPTGQPLPVLLSFPLKSLLALQREFPTRSARPCRGAQLVQRLLLRPEGRQALGPRPFTSNASSAEDVVLPRNLSPAPENVVLFFFFLIHRTFFWQVSTAPRKRHCPTRKENGTKAPHAPQLCRRSRPSAAQHGPAWPGPALRGPARRGTRAAAVPPSGPCRPRSPSAGHRARPARPGASGSPDAGRLRLLCGAAVGCRLAKGGGTRRALGLAGGTSIPPNRLRSPPSGCTRACVSAAGGAGATRPRLVAAPLRGGACLLGWVLLSRPGCLLLLPGFHRCKFIIFPLTYTPLSVGAVVKFRQFSLPLLHR